MFMVLVEGSGNEIYHEFTTILYAPSCFASVVHAELFADAEA
jgi:hypothetical protein